MNDDGSKQNWLGLLVPTVTFLVGLALGGVLVYANSDGGDQTSAGPIASAAPSGGVNDTVVTVPAACDQAATKVREAYSLLRTAVDQVRDFQADALVGTLNELEDVDGEARGLVSDCSAFQVDSTPAPASDGASDAPTEGATPDESGESDGASPDVEPVETPDATPSE